MVSLTRIYTKTGDGGKTRLGDNSQVEKFDPRVEAYGEVDELNALLGIARCHAEADADLSDLIGKIQNDLFDLGADLCWPLGKGSSAEGRLAITPEQVGFIEKSIDRYNAALENLHSFVLPGGSPLSAQLHLARTVCRRAERRVWTLAKGADLNEQVAIYLNRLSDLLFVLARRANDGGKADVLWVPGGGLEGREA